MAGGLPPAILTGVQPSLPFDAAPEHPVEYVRVRRARRYILRVRPDGTLRVTVPRGGSRAEAERFAERHRCWIDRERQRVRTEHAPATWSDGTTILVAGVSEVIRIQPSGSNLLISYGNRTIRARRDADVRATIEKDLRALAATQLVPRLQMLAAKHAVAVSRVSVRSQSSRWGSCSPSGAIALNFRLVQMPPEVRDYVLLHELMHRRQQNHSRRFWREVAAVCPGFRDAERWLRTRGRTLF